jgi:hypothetical protein
MNTKLSQQTANYHQEDLRPYPKQNRSHLLSPCLLLSPLLLCYIRHPHPLNLALNRDNLNLDPPSPARYRGHSLLFGYGCLNDEIHSAPAAQNHCHEQCANLPCSRIDDA